MANHKSAKKRHRQELRRRIANRDVRSACRTAIKQVRLAAEKGNLSEAEALLRKAQQTVATAATKKIFHPRNASRKISRLAALVNKAKA